MTHPNEAPAPWARSWRWSAPGAAGDGSELVGRFEFEKSAIAPTGPTRIARISLRNSGEAVDLWLNPASLDREWSRLLPLPGDLLRIRRARQMATSARGRAYYRFSVELLGRRNVA